MKSNMVFEPLTKLQCCPTSDGGAAAVLVSQDFLDARPHLKEQAILIAGQCLATDAPSLFSTSSIDLVGYEMTKFAAQTAMLRPVSPLQMSRSANCTIASPQTRWSPLMLLVSAHQERHMRWSAMVISPTVARWSSIPPAV